MPKLVGGIMPIETNDRLYSEEEKTVLEFIKKANPECQNVRFYVCSNHTTVSSVGGDKRIVVRISPKLKNGLS